LSADDRSYYTLDVSPKFRLITLKIVDGKREGTELQRWKVPEDYQGDKWASLELQTLVGELTATFDGKVLGTVRDSTLTEFTGFTLWAKPLAYFRDIEYVPLDKQPSVSASSPQFPPGQWVKLFTKPEDLPADLRKPGSGVKWEDGWIRWSAQSPSTILRLSNSMFKNCAVKYVVRRDSGSSSGSIVLRSNRDQNDQNVFYNFGVTQQDVVEMKRKQDDTYPVLSQRSAPQSALDSPEVALEFGAVGDQLLGSLNGSLFLVAKDATVKEGWAHINKATSSSFFIRDIEVINLDGLPEAEALRLLGVDEQGNDLRGKTGASAAAGPWQDAMSDSSQLTLGSKVERTPEGLSFNGIGSAVRPSTQGPRRDGAVRIRAPFGSLGPKLSARQNHKGDKYMLYAADTRRLALVRWDEAAKKGTVLREFPLPEPLKPGQDYEMELRIVGQTLTAKLNGELLGTASDGTLSEGIFGVLVGEGQGYPVLVKTLEVLDLDKAVSPSPNLPVSKSSDPKFPPGQWVKLFTKPEDIPAPAVIKDGWITNLVNWSVPKLDASNVVIRATFRDAPDTTKPVRSGLLVRYNAKSAPDDVYYVLQLQKGDRAAITRKHSQDSNTPTQNRAEQLFGQKVELPLNQHYTMEFAVVGDRLMGRINGMLLPVQRDTVLRKGRVAAIGSGDYNIRDIEVANLDGLPEAEALRLLGVDEQGKDVRGKAGANTGSTATTPTPVWRNALAEAPLKGVIATADHTDKGYLLPPGNHWEFPTQPVRAGAIRVLAVTEAGSPNHLSLNFGLPGTRDHYQVFFRRKLNECGLAYLKEGLPERRLALKKGVHLADGEPHELLLARIADEFYFLLNGQVILQAAEPDPTPRYLTLNCFGDTRTRVQKVEYLNLDGVNEAEALKVAGIFAASASPSLPVSSAPASATKAAPFVNTLGMKFVPVPITGGPTDKQRVLFSVWETRVQDYEVFAKETKREWTPWGGKTDRETYPAQSMSWSDAKAFAVWLTGHDLQAGRIPAGWVYRLPTDHEWSCAAGIGDREDAAAPPKTKDSKLDGLYLWGTQWPPPQGSGNFADESWLRGEGKNYPNREQVVIRNYDDGFGEIAPVGSFAPNALGLCDIAGNMAEMCEDLMSAGHRVLRGGPWKVGYPGRQFLASARTGEGVDEKQAGSFTVGFRLVLSRQ
jgi:hypothetical protein